MTLEAAFSILILAFAILVLSFAFVVIYEMLYGPWRDRKYERRIL